MLRGGIGRIPRDPAEPVEVPHEGFVEIIPTGEVAQLVLLGLAEKSFVDELEDDVPEILRLLNPPLLEDRLGHGTEPLQRETPDSVQEFLAPHVADLLQSLDGEMDRVEREAIRIGLVAPMLL